MLLYKVVNSIGLGFDIVGVLILFIFHLESLAPKKRQNGDVDWIQPDANEAIKRIKWNRGGVFLLVLGFRLQVLSNWL